MKKSATIILVVLLMGSVAASVYLLLDQKTKQELIASKDASIAGRDQSIADKLDYLINLLEEQQSEKTNNVTEEILLYAFLGIFIIFIVDSFSRVGKYVR